jgi:OFA family oxalate/formate antiporter-like MFS transporter
VRNRGAAAIAAATALNLPLGTLYAFSVYLKPIEALLGIGRTEMSFVFALATITLTVGMNFAPWFYRRFSPFALALGCAICGAAGLCLAATATTFAQFAIGYGVVVGPGAGIGFILVQQAVNQTVAKRRGLANGYVVSMYPLGAMIGAPILGWAIEAFGVRATLGGLGATVLATSVLAGLLLRAARIGTQDDAAAAAASADPQWSLFFRLAMVFFLAAAAGLMVMSQAAGIVQAYGGSTAIAVGATTVIMAAVGAARIAGGWLVDHFPIPYVGVGCQAVSLVGAAALTIWPAPAVAVVALSMIGVGYGVVSGLTAAAIARYWHKNLFGSVASRLYIAWCVAAVTLPILAGWIYDRTQGYGAALLVAGGANLIAIGIAARLPKP